MKSLLALFVISLLLTDTNLVVAQLYFSNTGTVNFHSETGIHGFTGTSHHLTGQIDLSNGTVDFYVDLETLDTGNGKRDRDMRETLETDKYPFAEFFGSIQTEFDPDKTEEQPVVVKGTFTLHGVEQQIEVPGSIEGTNEGLLVKADWVIRLEDYKIKPPRLLFIKVAQEQEIDIRILLKPKTN